MESNQHDFTLVDEMLSRRTSLDQTDNLDLSSICGINPAQPEDSVITDSGITVNEVNPISQTHQVPVLQIMNTQLRTVSRKYEIQQSMALRLQSLRDFEIVIVCDDSGSMMTTVDGTQRTRWDELCYIVKIVIEIGVIFDSNGVDIYFINGRTFEKVKDSKVVDQAFAKRPSGYTPLVPVLNQIFQSSLSHRGRDKKLLVFVATDGVPTDDDGNPNVPTLEYIMREKRQAETTYVSFLLCTDEPASINYLNEWDRTMKNVDVTDDFNTERNKIWQCRGRNHPFTLGDYVVKALVGAIDPAIKSRSTSI